MLQPSLSKFSQKNGTAFVAVSSLEYERLKASKLKELERERGIRAAITQIGVVAAHLLGRST